MRSKKNVALVALIALSFGAHVSWAADSSVPGDFATIQLAIDDAGTVAGDTITLNVVGAHVESNIMVTKSVTIAGLGIGTTSLQPGAGQIGFRPTADNVTIQDMTIEGCSQAIRFEDAGNTIDATTVLRVSMLNNSSRGIELHNATTVTNLTVNDCVFNNNGVGIRTASNSTVQNLTVTDSTFDTHSLHIYQANDGGTSTLDGLTVTGNTFLNHTDTAVFAEEVQNMVLDDNVFMDNNRGFTLFKFYDGAGVDAENLAITNNTFTDETQSSIILFAAAPTGGLTGTRLLR